MMITKGTVKGGIFYKAIDGIDFKQQFCAFDQQEPCREDCCAFNISDPIPQLKDVRQVVCCRMTVSMAEYVDECDAEADASEPEVDIDS